MQLTGIGHDMHDLIKWWWQLTPADTWCTYQSLYVIAWSILLLIPWIQWPSLRPQVQWQCSSECDMCIAAPPSCLFFFSAEHFSSLLSIFLLSQCQAFFSALPSVFLLVLPSVFLLWWVFVLYWAFSFSAECWVVFLLCQVIFLLWWVVFLLCQVIFPFWRVVCTLTSRKMFIRGHLLGKTVESDVKMLWKL